MCPIGIPGIDVTSWNAEDSGIQSCSLNLILDFKPFFSLKASKLKFFLTSDETASVSDLLFLPLAIN
jgi:hypothetical protein